jgi:hypothetical protein
VRTIERYGGPLPAVERIIAPGKAVPKDTLAELKALQARHDDFMAVAAKYERASDLVVQAREEAASGRAQDLENMASDQEIRARATSIRRTAHAGMRKIEAAAGVLLQPVVRRLAEAVASRAREELKLEAERHEAVGLPYTPMGPESSALVHALDHLGKTLAVDADTNDPGYGTPRSALRGWGLKSIEL